jgi:HPt (histidine-containing phosphotransfer) domain-containing protein
METIHSAVAKQGGASVPPSKSALGSRVPLDPDIEALVPKFIQDVANLVGKAQGALLTGDLEAIKAIGHKIKGAGGSFGFDRGAELGDCLKFSANAGDREKIAICFAELESSAKEVGKNGK